MAFIVKYENAVGELKEKTWRINEDKPGVRNVQKLYASGDELDLIRLEFDNIPICRNKQIVWNGEMARFIFDNLE
jgi:hypothetical protein